MNKMVNMFTIPFINSVKKEEIMSIYYLKEKEMKKIRVYFPKSRGFKRVDDCRVISGIITVLKNGLRCCDVPKEYGPYKTLYNRFMNWSKMGVFQKIFSSLVLMKNIPEQLQMDSTYIKVHRTEVSLLKKRAPDRAIGRTKGGLNSKIHAVTDGNGRPILVEITAGNISDYTVAERIMNDLPNSKGLFSG